MRPAGHLTSAARLLLCLCIWLIAGVTPAQDHEAVTDAQRFLAALTGSWTGTAERTPIGPRPYDITFTRTAHGRVEGSANPGRSIHFWSFHHKDGELRLRFLSTFAGNRDPIFLIARESDARGVLFRTENPPLLSVRLLPGVKRLNIDVFHWDRLHVSIRLRRA